MEIHLELPSLLYECRRREYLRAIFRHSRTQLCKQVFASGVKESIAATLQRYRSSFSTISDERKFPILRSKFYIWNFRIFSLNFVYCNNNEDITTRLDVVFITSQNFLRYTNVCESVRKYENFNRWDYYSLKLKF